MIESLTKDDLEWLDRIGVDERRMKIILKNQEIIEKLIWRIGQLKMRSKSECVKIIKCNDKLYCDCEWCCFGDELQSFFKGDKNEKED